MKKDLLYITIAAVVICIVGVIAYLVMNDLGYFDKADNFSGTGLGGAVLIPIMKYIWDKVLQLISLLITIGIGILIICGLGLIF